jgi:RNA polymerase sigma factor for flagellar operon FliA
LSKPGEDRALEARNILVEQNLDLVQNVLAQLRARSRHDHDDLHSAGIVGLMHAAASFDGSKGASFRTWAWTVVRGAVLDEMRRADPVPKNRRARLRRIEQTRDEMRGKGLADPADEQLAALLGTTVEQVQEDLRSLASARTVSLELDSALRGSAALAVELALAAPDDPMQEAARREQHARLVAAVHALPEPDCHVVTLCHLGGLQAREVAHLLEVSPARVSQILARALDQLRRQLADR